MIGNADDTVLIGEPETVALRRSLTLPTRFSTAWA